MPAPSLSVSPVPLPPDSICGYRIVRSLSADSYLAIADGGRLVVLKPVDADCLLQGQLHPSIKERLARVRELAFKGDANLHGIERDSHGAFLIWQYIDGQPLEEAVADLSMNQLTLLVREIVLAVESLHALGIVHGALHARNIILDPSRGPVITHVSPLLHHDPAVDETATLEMLNGLLRQKNVSESQLSRIAREAVPGRTTLRQLAGRLAAVTSEQAEPARIMEFNKPRRSSLIWALAVALVGMSVAIGAYILARTSLAPPADAVESSH